MHVTGTTDIILFGFDWSKTHILSEEVTVSLFLLFFTTHALYIIIKQIKKPTFPVYSEMPDMFYHSLTHC